MRKIIVATMVTLDGVMQAPGGSEEDTSGGFEFGGWTPPYSDAIGRKIVQEQMQPAAYLLGRKTYEIFASYWPHHADFWPGINEGPKYVLSNTLQHSDWKNTQIVRDVEAIKRIKNEEGPDLQVWGSSELVQLLLQHDLVDEFWLRIYPLTIGKGKKLFQSGTIPAAFTLKESVATTKGVLIATYVRSGPVQSGTIQL